MAKVSGVWGIELGQSALKALRCRRSEEAGKIVADAFDFIEYPKSLNEPDVDSHQLIKEALEKFLSRNTVKGDKVSISVPGQSGLARFIKLPPVEPKKIPDIVKYEARQQIPFPLDEVIWDYQQISGGAEEEGYLLESEVGLFAMKTEQVYKALEPFNEANIEVDIIQLTPLALYNYLLHDQLTDLPPAEEYDPDDPPESTVILSLGSEASDLVISNGYKVWQRPIPLGGTHFTKALMKELDLTYAKAEHLKRNATASSDPKVVFQAMRPVFNDLVTEVQRSIGFYMNLDRNAKIKRVIAVGNVMKLPGLRTYLQQNMGYEFEKLDHFNQLKGPAVVDSPQFKENIFTFAPCYGLALQALGQSSIRTNLIPQEIVTERLIRSKKPWAMSAAAALLLGLTVSVFGYWRAWSTVHNEEFNSPMGSADTAVQVANQFKQEYEEQLAFLAENKTIGERLTINLEKRTYWSEVVKSVNLCLPQSRRIQQVEIPIIGVPDTAFGQAPTPNTQAVSPMGPMTPMNPTQVKPMPMIPMDPVPADPAAPKTAPAAEAVPEAGAAEGGAQADEGEEGERAPAAKSKSDSKPNQTQDLDAEQWWEKIKTDGDIHITRVEVELVDDLANWWTMVQHIEKRVDTSSNPYESNATGPRGFQTPAPVTQQPDPNAEEGPQGPTGQGWVVQLTGHHFHNPLENLSEQGLEYLRKEFLDYLMQPYLLVKDSSGKMTTVDVGDLGIQHPRVVRYTPILRLYDPNLQPNYDPPTWKLDGGSSRGGYGPSGGMSPSFGIGGGSFGGEGAFPGSPPGIGGGRGTTQSLAGQPKQKEQVKIQLPRFDFQIQFIWTETPYAKREAIKQQRILEAQKKAEEEKLKAEQAGV